MSEKNENEKAQERKKKTKSNKIERVKQAMITLRGMAE